MTGCYCLTMIPDGELLGQYAETKSEDDVNLA